MADDARAESLVRALGLAPHPEGGWYRELFRSPSPPAAAGPGARAALTVIYFLLARGQRSRWHRVDADEAWLHLEGDPLELLLLAPGATSLERRVLGPVGADQAPVQVVPAGWWQAAAPLGAHALASCAVGPGFEFRGFALLDDVPPAERDAVLAVPGAAPFA
ncbi:MAG: cupin domain-containing protein [Gemmatimonadales bacterium]|nr:cupin domain-containing protein [Gemmatimonadales bacterium]